MVKVIFKAKREKVLEVLLRGILLNLVTDDRLINL